MKLSESQIQELYSFTVKHYVLHYDLQTELVDHLANGIEEQWAKNPEISFKNALLKEFRKFGVGGFEKVIRKRKMTMEKRYWRLIFRFYKDFFRFPRIVLTIGLVFLLTTVFKLTAHDYKYDLFLTGMFIIILVSMVELLKNRKHNELERTGYEKKWMLKDQIYSFGNIVNALNCIPIVMNIPMIRNLFPMNSLWIDIVFAIILVAMILLTYTSLVILPKKAEELLAETYPEYKMV